MRRYIISAIILFVVPFAMGIDYEAAPIAYCQHMDYAIEADSFGNPQCVFSDGSSCSAFEFYQGTCGTDKAKTIEPRKEGESVYVEFERCQDGLIPSKPEYLLDQPVCEKKPAFFNNCLSIIVGGIKAIF